MPPNLGQMINSAFPDMSINISRNPGKKMLFYKYKDLISAKILSHSLGTPVLSPILRSIGEYTIWSDRISSRLIYDNTLKASPDTGTMSL